MQPGLLKKFSASVIAKTMIVNLKATLPAIASSGRAKAGLNDIFSPWSTQGSTGCFKKISASVIANTMIVNLKASLQAVVSSG